MGKVYDILCAPRKESSTQEIKMTPGNRLKELRSQLGISLREVEQESQKIAAERANPEFVVSNHWLTKLENGDRQPSLYTLFTLSAVYRIKFSELLSFFDIDLEWLSTYQLRNRREGTYILSLESPDPKSTVNFPVSFDPGFRVEATNLISRMVEVWGEVPVSILRHMDLRRNRYGYIGLEDYTMYPLLRPGSFVVIDESLKKVQASYWRTEMDRPIYFVELRDGYACSWCEMDGDALLLIPHPLSPCQHRRIDAKGVEIVGQVVAVASRIVDVEPAERPPRPALPSPKQS